MQKRIKETLSGRTLYLIISVVIFVALLSVGTLSLGPKIVSLSRDPEALRQYLGSGGIKSYTIFLAIQFIQTVFALIPGEFVEIAAGYLYGSVKGLILCLLGVGVATALIFSLTRLLGKKFTEITIDSKDLKRLRFLQDEKKLEIMFALLFFIPGTPKDLITYFAGVTKIKFIKFMAISLFCRIPSILTSTLAGDALGEQSYLQSAIIFAVTGLVGICGVLFYKKLTSKHKNKT